MLLDKLPMRLTAFVVVLLGCACSSAPLAPRSWLDERTAATITVQRGPMVLAREEQTRAINVRDYVQLGAAEVNRAGNRQLYLVLLLWSTIDRSAAELQHAQASLARIALQADDRTIQLQSVSGEPSRSGFGGRPFAHPAPGTREVYFAVTRSELQSVALSRTLVLVAMGEGEPQRYLEWRNGRPGLSAFLAQSSAPR